jgi:uncharacterized protein YndB with AHSA1/START domain
MTNSDALHAPVTAIVSAPREAVYRAFTDPVALAAWQAPGEMTATVHDFDLRIGGGYTMTLRYPESIAGSPGKTTAREDRYTARFVDLVPGQRIVQAITFDTTDSAFMGEMTMTVTLEAHPEGTCVTIAYANVPPGIRPEDNEAGTRMSLAKLAACVEDDRGRAG